MMIAQPIFEGVHSVALVANGVVSDFQLIARLIHNYEKCIAIDGGLQHCHLMNIQPDLIVGDCDSVGSELLYQYRNIPIATFPVDKDDSDTKLAADILHKAGVKKIGLFAAFGSRIDHSLANLYLMSNFADQMVIETETDTSFIVSGRRTIECQTGQTISLFPLGAPARGVTTRGLKWELDNATIDRHFFSLANVSQRSSVEIEINDGTLICCLVRI